eukprot:Clim_evm8s172 gene=Clim_evmTU8s172
MPIADEKSAQAALQLPRNEADFLERCTNEYEQYCAQIERLTGSLKRQKLRFEDQEQSLTEWLASLDINLDSFDYPTRENVQEISAVATALNATDCTEGSILPLLSELTIAGDQVEEHSAELRSQQRDIVTRIEMLKDFGQVVEAVECQVKADLTARKAALEKDGQWTSFLRTKEQEYKRNAQQYELHVDQQHEDLVSSYKDLQKKKALVASKEQSLAKYRDLPPDLTAARIQLQDAKRELAEMDRRIALHLNDYQ